MRFVPKISVHAQLTLTIMLAILLSWMLSTGLVSYMAFRNIQMLRQMMLSDPQRFPEPIPEPKFGLKNFVLPGPMNFMPPERQPQPNQQNGQPRQGLPPGLNPNNPRTGAPGGMDPRPQGPPQDQQIQPPPPGSPPPPGQPAPQLGGRPPRANQPGIQAISPRILLITHIITALALATLFGLFLSRQFSKPLAELARGANEFHQGKFKHRIKLEGNDEFTDVARSMNDMAGQVSRQIERLEEDAKRRQQFLADVAHELRGPVTTMRTMSGALLEGVADDPERRKRALESMVRTSDRMLHLVVDLLELTRLDLKELPLHRSNVDICELVNSEIQSHMASAVGADIKLNPFEAQCPIQVNIDPDRIAQVIDNILDNAISHAGEGAEVKVSLAGTDPIMIVISDNGRGIPARHLPNLFEPFYRVDSARKPGDNHSGLGLKIARALVELHGGKLELKSEEGKGTEVSITLPVNL